MKVSDVKRALKANKTGPASFYLGEVDGVTWFTDSYMACPLGKHVANVLADNNLAPLPGMYGWEGTSLRFLSDNAPNLGAVVNAPDERASAKPELLLGRPALIELDGGLYRVFSADGGMVAVNASYLDLVLAEGSPDGSGLTYETAGPREPLFVFDGDRKIGLVMGVRVP